jgi:hypothetical protein
VLRPEVVGPPRRAYGDVRRGEAHAGALERGNAVARRDVAFRRDFIPTATV